MHPGEDFHAQIRRLGLRDHAVGALHLRSAPLRQHDGSPDVRIPATRREVGAARDLYAGHLHADHQVLDGRSGEPAQLQGARG